MAREAQIARAAARAVFAVFAAANWVTVEVTLQYEATMQAAVPQLCRAVKERGREAVGVALVTTAVKWATSSRSAQISSGIGPLLRRSSREKPRPSDARLGITGPYCY